MSNIDENTIEIPESIKSDNNFENNSVDDIVDGIVENTINSDIVSNASNPTKRKTVLISATSKVSAQLKDVWYGFTFTESRQIFDDSDIESERQDLWNTVNVEVDNQVQDVMELIKSK